MRKLYALVSFFTCFQIVAQDTTRILFVGNSFTYYNNMPQLVKAFADSAHIPMAYAMHAPGGISVGDISQGTQAHMNNPVLYALIRSKKWDVMVLQDNQGRFVRDSAQFPATTVSKVVEGHFQLMDSLKATNTCAKVVLFGGWGFQNGSPPYGNTGIEMIKRILVNYCVLNDSMKEVIAPIGLAWIKGINYLPAVDLWDTDQAHPSLYGSYLTASVIFSSIFNFPSKNLNYTAGITSGTASVLRAFSDSVVFDPAVHAKYNLGGMKKITINSSNGQLSLSGNYLAYKWFHNKTLVGTSATLPLNANGSYYALAKDNDNCYIKSCTYTELTTGVSEHFGLSEASLFPNPSSGTVFFKLAETSGNVGIRFIDAGGRSYLLNTTCVNGEGQFDTSELAPGCYLLELSTPNTVFHRKLLINR